MSVSETKKSGKQLTSAADGLRATAGETIQARKSEAP
jgi:hypothetical protein